MPHLHVLYVDADTFLYSTLEQMKVGLERGSPYMHLQETALCSGSYKTIHSMWKYLAGKTFLGYKINEQTTMWNAGVIAISAGKAAEYIGDTLMLCDALTETPCPPKLFEQLAFSMVLDRNQKLTAAERIIGHYWGSKDPWNTAIQDFLLAELIEGKSLAQLAEATTDFDYFAHPLKGGGYRKTARRLHRLVDRLVPRKRKIFFRKSN